MKLVVLLTLVFSLHAVAETRAQKITLSVRNVTLQEVMKQIQKQQGVSFFFRGGNIAKTPVTVDLKNVDFRDAMRIIIENRGFGWSLDEGIVTIYTDKEEPQKKQVVHAPQEVQENVISGQVTDSKGEALAGVTVGLRNNANIGTTTDENGRYALKVPQYTVVVFRYMGYLNKEVNVGVQTEINARLEIDLADLDEVVVIGYGIAKKSDLTGAVSSVSEKQFKDQPVRRIEEILQGRAAGVEVTNSSGMVGSAPKVRVRGTTSINKSSDPLYVINGIVSTTDLNGINPADILSIEVLKDASATAIYGSRGANGVVLVTTKKGIAGEAVLAFEADLGLANIAREYDILNAYEYGLALNDFRGLPVISSSDLQEYKSGAKGIDWQDVMTKTGVTQDYRLSLSGGSEKTKYLVSLNSIDQQAVTVFSGIKQDRVRMNVDTEVKPWLNIVGDANIGRIKSKHAAFNFETLLNYSPTMEMENPETGVYNRDPYNVVNYNNPYGILATGDNDNKKYLVNGYLDFRFKIMNGLTFSVLSGLNYENTSIYTFGSSLAGPNMNSSMSNVNSRNLFWQNTLNLTYNKAIGQHQIMATAVWETSKSEGEYMNISGNNLQTESVRYWNVNMAATQFLGNGYAAEQIASGVGRVMYNYGGRYMLTGTFRADGSSKFIGDNKWGYFPSGAVAWNIAEENFMKDQTVFQQFKIRTSAGITGNQAVEQYATLDRLQHTYTAYGQSQPITGYWGGVIASPDLRWEKTYQYDAGLDMSILNRRLNISYDWFYKDTKDLLFRKTAPYYNGGGTFWVNQGAIRNVGHELTLNGLPFSSDNFNWESTFTAAYVQNKVLDMAGDPFQLIGGGGLMGPPEILKPGETYGTYNLYDWAGFDDQGANLYRTADGQLTNAPSADDKIVTGRMNPLYTFGLNNIFSWKNWEANIFLNAATGVDRLNVTRFMMSSVVGETNFITLRDAYFKAWDNVANKENAEYPSLTNPNGRYLGDATQWLENAAFLKIRNISVSYRIPRAITKITDIRLAVSAQNVHTFTKYKGMDPEVGGGIDQGAYPVPRTITFGVKATF